MKIGIYAPYLDVFGGGEKYICKIASILSKENDVEFLVFKKPDITKLQNRFSIDLHNVCISCLSLPNIISKIPYIRGLARSRILAKVSAKYDLFINQDDILLIPVLAKRGILLYQVPPTTLNRPSILFNNPFFNLFNDYKLKTYGTVLCYSFFSKKWIEKYYRRKIEVLYPPIDTEEFTLLPKQKIILSVGRFFQEVHCKKQFEMIRAFKKLKTNVESLKNWEYHLVGGVTDDDKAQEYLKNCQDEAQGCLIYFHINAPFRELKELYGRAKIFWHATGLNEDENKYPDRMEHFGMTTVEAMSAGCVPVVINKGGQPEIVRNELDGFLWNNVEELIKYTVRLASEEDLCKAMSDSSIKRSQMFSNTNFEKELKRILA